MTKIESMGFVPQRRAADVPPQRGGLKAAAEMVTQARHHRHLQHCLAYLSQARELLTTAPAWELVALELREAVGELGEITGQEVGEDVLDRIFAQFCLGK